VYGKGQDPASPYSGVISRFLADYAAKKDLIIFGDGLQTRDFIHVEDVAAANVKALESDYSGALNIATGQPETLLDLVRYIESAYDVKLACSHQEARPGDIRASYGKTQLAHERIDFSAKIPLKQGVSTILG
jgi:UDP-glucose 4-epimerase